MYSNPYRIFCPFLDEVISIKVLSPEEEVKLSGEVYNTLVSSKEKVVAAEFRQYVCSLVIENWEPTIQKIIDSIYGARQSAKEKDIFKRYIRDLYHAVLSVYSTLDLEMMLSQLNTIRMKEDWSAYLKKVMLGLDEDIEDKDLDYMPKESKSSPKATPLPKSGADLKKLEDTLNRLVIGQEEAVHSTVNSVKLMCTGLADFSTLFFVGPTGNGKTRLAKMLSDIYYKDRFFKINCGEYSNPHEYAKLIGSPPGYVGYTDKSLLAEKAEKSNGWVFLFDEIEKAHPKFYDFLLNLMDEGKVMDANGKDLDFSRSLFIFTSNQGTGDIKHNPLGFGRTKKKGDDLKKELSETFRESVKKHFSPEFINRIDKTIIFNQLNKEQLLKVVKLELAGIPVKKTKELLTYIIENGYSEEYGGRHIAKFIKNNIAILIADAVLEGVSPTSGNYYTCKVKDNTPYLVEMRKK
jgi:ATP-dependent Clp protease ATP-binding subunit ClpC